MLHEVRIFHDLCLHFAFSGCCSFLTNEPVNVDNTFLIFGCLFDIVPGQVAGNMDLYIGHMFHEACIFHDLRLHISFNFFFF